MTTEAFNSLDIQIDDMINSLIDKCNKLLLWENLSEAVLADPNDEIPIYAHYSMTHYAAALFIHYDKSEWSTTAYPLLESLIKRWSTDSRLPDFHHDFNNFAMCLIQNQLETAGDIDNAQAIRSLILNTPDSGGKIPWHNTINWLPMRIYVNKQKFIWTTDKKFNDRCKLFLKLIESAQYRDGFIDDLMPKGKSFNLQYDIATAALLQFLNENEILHFPIEQPLHALIQATGPDGDCNYIGRGTNQLFAWGPWLYLLKAKGQTLQFKQALNMLNDYLPSMLKNNNLLLNHFPGIEKEYWMDYHYCSVYFAHFLLWLVLTSKLDWPKHERQIEPMALYSGDSGLSFMRTNNFFVAKFNGRRAYLSEKGPMIEQVWVKGLETIIKSAFGPAPDHFGCRYSSGAVSFNCFSVLSWDSKANAFICSFPKVEVIIDNDILIFRFSCDDSKLSIVNIPLINPKAMKCLSVYANDELIRLRETMKIKNAYGHVHVAQTEPCNTSCWVVTITVQDNDE